MEAHVTSETFSELSNIRVLWTKSEVRAVLISRWFLDVCSLSNGVEKSFQLLGQFSKETTWSEKRQSLWNCSSVVQANVDEGGHALRNLEAACVFWSVWAGAAAQARSLSLSSRGLAPWTQCCRAERALESVPTARWLFQGECYTLGLTQAPALLAYRTVFVFQTDFLLLSPCPSPLCFSHSLSSLLPLYHLCISTKSLLHTPPAQPFTNCLFIGCYFYVGRG